MTQYNLKEGVSLFNQTWLTKVSLKQTEQALHLNEITHIIQILNGIPFIYGYDKHTWTNYEKYIIIGLQ